MKVTTDIIITKENQDKYKALTECRRLIINEGAKAEFPVLTTSGNIDLREGAKLIHPKTKNLNYISVDNTMFVIESEKNSKGIKIYAGYVLESFKDKKLQKKACYVAMKDKHFAHGETVRKAVTDLQFKLIAEKLKKDPIKKDTVITIQYYRIITGACEMGIKSWMKANKAKDEYKAADLLPLLENTNAYGLEKFKSLITF